MSDEPRLLPARAGAGPAPAGVCLLRATRQARALVVHEDEPDAALLDFAARCADEAGHGVVVLDVPPDTPPEALEQVAGELAALPGRLRLVPARPSQTSTSEYGGWIADRIARPVLAHEGAARVVAGGGLYIEPAEGRGWLLALPGGRTAPGSRRFPRPDWECEALAEPRDLGSGFVLEPLPAGVWIHGAEADAAAYRRRLLESVLPDVHSARIVLGRPGSPMIPPDLLTDFWASLSAAARRTARFAEFGDALRGPAAYGQELADALETAVVVGSGVPLFIPTAAGGAERRILLAGGTMLWDPYAEDFEYLPGSTGASNEPHPDPTPLDVRPPIPGLVERGSGLYDYEDDVVLEVTRSGLWLRPARLPSNSAAVRALPAHPERAEVVFSAETPALTERMRRSAEQLVRRLDPQAQAAAVVRPARDVVPAVVVKAEAVKAAVVAAPVVATEVVAAPVVATEVVAAPVVTTEVGRIPQPVGRESVQSADIQAAPIPVSAADLADERVRLRSELGGSLGAAMAVVARILAGLPDTGLDPADEETMTDLAALRLYLDGPARPLADALRHDRPGPHSTMARCVAAGLRRLPVYRGATRLRTDLSEEEWQWYGEHEEFGERGFTPVLTGPREVPPGRVEVLIWSVTARRTALIQPALPEQAVFLPGTRFRVLNVSRGPRPTMMLRELAAGEAAVGGVAAGIGPAGDGEPGVTASLDSLASAALEQAADAWARARPGRRLGPEHLDRFSSAPGLIMRTASVRASGPQGPVLPGPEERRESESGRSR